LWLNLSEQRWVNSGEQQSGSGNICGYVDGTSGLYSANYEYGTFGEGIRVSGPVGKDIPFRFSSKYFDTQTEMVYYGYRYYNSSTGRWLSRDPIEEAGGINVNAFVGNATVSSVDPLGEDFIAVADRIVRPTPFYHYSVQYWITDSACDPELNKEVKIETWLQSNTAKKSHTRMVVIPDDYGGQKPFKGIAPPKPTNP